MLTGCSGLVVGALLGTQNGRDVEIVNTFELAVEDNGESIDHGFLISRREQCKDNHMFLYIMSIVLMLFATDKQVFPSLEFIGWYTVAPKPTAHHITLHTQVRFPTVAIFIYIFSHVVPLHSSSQRIALRHSCSC